MEGAIAPQGSPVQGSRVPAGCQLIALSGAGGSEWDGEEEDQGGQDLVGPRLVSVVKSRPSRQRTKSFSGF